MASIENKTQWNKWQRKCKYKIIKITSDKDLEVYYTYIHIERM